MEDRREILVLVGLALFCVFVFFFGLWLCRHFQTMVWGTFEWIVGFSIFTEVWVFYENLQKERRKNSLKYKKQYVEK